VDGGARELFALGDFSGSLEMIEKILKVDGGHAEARAYLRQNESTLVSMYESKLGSLTNVPRLAIKPEEVMWLNLDHRAGFLLAQVDGSVNFEELFASPGCRASTPPRSWRSCWPTGSSGAGAVAGPFRARGERGRAPARPGSRDRFRAKNVV